MSLPVYPEYKDSGFEWLGHVPAQWQVVRIKHALDRMGSGGTPDTSNPLLWAEDCGTAWVAIGDMSDRDVIQATTKSLSVQGLESKALEVWPPGTLLFSMYASLGHVAELAIPAATNQAILALLPDENVHQGFLKRWFECLRPNLRQEASSNTQDNLNAEKVRNLPFFLPTKAEQLAISIFLDHKTGKIDALIAEQEKLLALLAEKRQATISHAVTHGLNPSVPMKDSGIPWLGEVPKHWEIVPFRYCVDFQEGPGIMAVDFYDEGVPLLRVSGVQGNWATLDGCNYLDPKRVEERWHHFRVEEGDLLISASASMGTVCEVGSEVVGSIPYTGIIRLKGIPGIMAKTYIRHLVVSSQFLTQIDLLKAGATIQHFGPTHLSQMVVAKPPAEEQVEIAEYLDAAVSKYSKLESQAGIAIELLKERRSALIAAAVTGKIDVLNAVPREVVAG